METRKFALNAHAVKTFRNDPNFVEIGKDDNGNVIFHDTRIEVILSKREKEVYDMKDQGNDEIANRLGISVKSVESYRRKIYHKIGDR